MVWKQELVMIGGVFEAIQVPFFKEKVKRKPNQKENLCGKAGEN
jgi:hypothetical protein